MSVHTSTTPDLADPQETILRALQGVDHVRRVDLAKEINEPYPPHEETLTHRGMMEEVGVESETNEDGDTVIYRRFRLTSAGERALRVAAQPDPEPESVEPTVRKSHRAPWYETAEWTAVSPAVGRILDETQSVEFIPAQDADSGEDTVRVSLKRGGVTGTIEFNLAQWHLSTGVQHFNDGYWASFQEKAGLKNDVLPEDQFGILKAHWIDEFGDEAAP
ncbi:hypothetical protein V5735_01570 (plasmid) [Haladaptatus sp. SPP-AMP-3]|uniref:hypothetical protein n=1 Tax=Haladaptatus sp. SPP-AMP-3 TaxID=3121295 RepID=UPI003C2F05CC